MSVPDEGTKQLDVLLVAEESPGMQTLRAIDRGPHRVVAVVASRPEESDQGGSMWGLATRMGYPTWEAEQVRDAGFADRVRRENVDILLNVHSLYLIPSAVLEAVPLGAYNMHPGRLPEYAGLNTVSWAIYRGEAAHAVTVHEMRAGIDTGRIVYQTHFPIEDDDTALSLYSKCAKAGVPLMMRLLDAAAATPPDIPMTEQDLAKRGYYGRDAPQDGRLDWNRPAREVVDFVRACDYLPFESPWGHPRTELNGAEAAILKASSTGDRTHEAPGTVGEVLETGALVAAADEWISVGHVMLGGRQVKAAEALKPGDRFEDGT